jgi:hypothetical protein
MTFLDLVKIEVDYHRLAHDLSAQRLVRLRHDTVFSGVVLSLTSSLHTPHAPIIATYVQYTANHLSPTRDDQLGRQALNHLVLLIARQASHCDDPSIWFGSRGPNVQNFSFNLQHVTGAGWIRPIKLAASPNDTASQRQAAFNQKAHGDRSSVPSARRQAQKTGVFGSLIIKVERLRVELTSKCFNLLFINNVGSARKALSNLEIIEIEPIAAAEFRHGRPNHPNW